MKLYNTKGATNPRRVLIYLAEKGLLGKIDGLEIEDIAILKGEHKTPEYRKISPLSQVPCLVFDDGSTLTESVAICRYFEALYPTPPLFGRDNKEAALVEMWVRRIDMLFLMPVAMHFRHLHPAMAQLEKQIEEWGKLNKARVESMMGFFDKHLADKEFLLGDYYSFADIMALATLDFATATKIPIPEELTSLIAYHERLRARPSAKEGI